MHIDEARGLLANLFSQGLTFILTTLGYTPANKAGDTFVGNVGVGNVAPITAAAGTLLNAPVAGNPTKWIPINDNGVTRYIPVW